MSDSASTPGLGGSAFAAARTNIGELIALVVTERGRVKLSWILEICLLSLTNILVLHSIERAVGVDAAERVPLGDLAMFALGVALNLVLQARVSQRVLDTVNRTVTDTTERILEALGRLDLEQFEAVGREEILSRLNEDAVQIVPKSYIVIQLLSSLPTVALSMLYVSTISAQAAVVSLAVMVAIAVFVTSLNQKTMEQIQRDQAANRRMQEPIDDLLAGFKQLRQHSPRSAAIAKMFEAEASAFKSSRDAYNREYYTRDTLSRQAYFVLLGAVGFILPRFMPNMAMGVSQLLVAVTFIFRPVTTVVMTTPMLAQLGAVWQRLTGLADRLDAMAAAEVESAPLPRPFTRLTLRGVVYRYPPRERDSGFSVGPCDLELSPGEIIFITGANGSGKSTFVKLLCGLYRRHGGELAVDGQPLPEDPGPTWRSRFAAVFAEFALFDRAYGLEDVEPGRVTALLAELELSHKVRFAQGRFDTVELSTGQRKRLALLVALLQDRPVYIFDEWAADQDPHFREAFYRRILPDLKARGKTVVAVTHDDDAFDACDRRFHFEHGQMERV